MRFEFKRDEKLKEWSWMLKSDNRQPVAVSAKPYRDRSSCLAAIEVVKRGAHEAEAFEVAAF